VYAMIGAFLPGSADVRVQIPEASDFHYHAMICEDAKITPHSTASMPWEARSRRVLRRRPPSHFSTLHCRMRAACCDGVDPSTQRSMIMITQLILSTRDCGRAVR
jgi:hypothetical protein